MERITNDFATRGDQLIELFKREIDRIENGEVLVEAFNVSGASTEPGTWDYRFEVKVITCR